VRTHQGPDLPYSVVAGVVPISAGWLVASAKLRGATFAPEESRLFDSFREVIDVRPSFSIVVLNVPIGYVDEPGTAQRSCDLEAQALLGGHSLALPPALTRASLFAGGDIDSGPHLDEDDYRFERYREVALEMSPSSQRIVYEGRPELSFYQLNNYEALRWSGESEQGREERRGILERKVPGVTRVLDADMPGVDRRELHDVAALLWTARRVFGHSAGRLPSEGEWDSEGLRMELVM
jgi:predicted RNase H-like nuclease